MGIFDYYKQYKPATASTMRPKLSAAPTPRVASPANAGSTKQIQDMTLAEYDQWRANINATFTANANAAVQATANAARGGRTQDEYQQYINTINTNFINANTSPGNRQLAMSKYVPGNVPSSQPQLPLGPNVGVVGPRAANDAMRFRTLEMGPAYTNNFVADANAMRFRTPQAGGGAAINATAGARAGEPTGGVRSAQPTGNVRTAPDGGGLSWSTNINPVARTADLLSGGQPQPTGGVRTRPPGVIGYSGTAGPAQGTPMSVPPRVTPPWETTLSPEEFEAREMRGTQGIEYASAMENAVRNYVTTGDQSYMPGQLTLAEIPVLQQMLGITALDLMELGYLPAGAAGFVKPPLGLPATTMAGGGTGAGSGGGGRRSGGGGGGSANAGLLRQSALEAGLVNWRI